LREVVPGLRRLAIMANVGAPGAVLEMREAQAAARTLGLRGRRIRNPASGGNRACFRDAQGPRRNTLCCFRPAPKHQSARRSRAAPKHFMLLPTRS
jgi:hypothetical protein